MCVCALATNDTLCLIWRFRLVENYPTILPRAGKSLCSTWAETFALIYWRIRYAVRTSHYFCICYQSTSGLIVVGLPNDQSLQKATTRKTLGDRTPGPVILSIQCIFKVVINKRQSSHFENTYFGCSTWGQTLSICPGFRYVSGPFTLVEYLIPIDPSSWLPVACFLPPLAPVSTLFHFGASVDNSAHLWLHLRTYGYFLLKETKRESWFSSSCWYSPVFLRVSSWLSRLILHGLNYSCETGD